MLYDEGYRYTYVCQDEFSSDWLKETSSMLRLGFGGAYFVKAQQVTEKHRIHHAKFQKSLNQETTILKDTHSLECCDCGYFLDSTEQLLFEELRRLVVDVSDEAKSTLIHITGYVVRKNIPDSDYTRNYVKKCGKKTQMCSTEGHSVLQEIMHVNGYCPVSS